MAEVKIKIVQMEHARGLALPAYETAGASGMDVRAAIGVSLVIPPWSVLPVPTGLQVQIPRGYEIQVRPRSGLAMRHCIDVANTPGTIDSDYRGEIKVLLRNNGGSPYVVARGDRIAQLVLAVSPRAVWVPVDALDGTARGAGGFGSTGTG